MSTGWLSEHLGQSRLRVLDASWYLPSTGRDARAEFGAGHIPGARYFDLDEVSDDRTSLPHMLPMATQFAEQVGALRVGNDSTVVVYDGSGANLSAGRACGCFGPLATIGSRYWTAAAKSGRRREG